MNKPTAMEIKAARAACKRHAEICNVDEQDLWKMHGEEFIEDAKLSLDSAGAPGLLEALKEMLDLEYKSPSCQIGIVTPCKCHDCIRGRAIAAIANVNRESA